MKDECNPEECDDRLKQIKKDMGEVVKQKLNYRKPDAVDDMIALLDRYETLAADGIGCRILYNDILFNTGCAFDHAGRLEKSVEIHMKAVEQNPEDHQALFCLGTNLVHLGRAVQAEEYLMKAVRLKPDEPDYVQNLREARARRRTAIRGPIC